MIKTSGKYKRIFSHTGWQLAEKVSRIVIGLFVSVWMARTLGPEKFGVFNYAYALASIFAILGTGGLDKIGIKYLTSRLSDDTGKILGSLLTLRILYSLQVILLVYVISKFVLHDTEHTVILALLFSVSSFFMAASIANIFFQASLQGHILSGIQTAGFIAGTALRIAILYYYDASLTLLAASYIAENVIIFIVGIFLLRKPARFSSWKIDVVTMKNLTRQGFPLIISSLAIILYVKIDQIMLARLAGNIEVGIYAAATRISEGWYFLPTTIATSLFPLVVRASENSEATLRKRIMQLTELLLLISIVVALLISVFSHQIIELLYGKAYTEASNVLILHIWSGIAVCAGLVSSQWLLIKNLQHLIVKRTLFGCGLNILLNYILIPLYGAYGAALATVVSYFAATYSVLLSSEGKNLYCILLTSFKFKYAREFIRKQASSLLRAN